MLTYRIKARQALLRIFYLRLTIKGRSKEHRQVIERFSSKPTMKWNSVKDFLESTFGDMPGKSNVSQVKQFRSGQKTH